VTVADGPGFGEMMVEPQDARMPVEVIELVGSWLDDGTLEREASAGAADPRLDAVLDAPGASAPSDRGEMIVDWRGAEVRETPLFLDGGGTDGRLFAVLAEPLGERRELTAVLLNAGPQRRIGPNRMWVEIARRWAASGVPTVRLDAAGIGDADGDTKALGQVTAFYRQVYVEQARAALAQLAARGLPPRFVMLGLCSGGYWSAQAALTDERVAGVMMLNPRTLVFDEWRHTRRRMRHLGRQMLAPSTWRRVLTGEIMFSKHLETGRTLVDRAASGPMRARERVVARRQQRRAAPRRAAHQPIEDLFDSLRERDQDALLMFTGKEVLRTELTDNGVLDRIDRWPNLELALMGTSADTHTLTPLWLQRQVHALVDRALERELGRLPRS
jgi:hypothetical protein